MTAELNRYLIAIVPPSPISEDAFALKTLFMERYGSKASLNSPAHITLHMPFLWKRKKEPLLLSALENFFSSFSAMTLQLEDFDCFRPRVIFIRVLPSEALKHFQKELSRYCRRALNLFHPDYKDVPYHPHLTVAFRDLRKPMFLKAWEEFQSKEYTGEFLVNEVSLLKHNGKKWEVMRNFSLNP